MLAVIVNTIAIVLGSMIGLLFQAGIPKRVSDTMVQAMGLCTIIIGLQGVLVESHILLMILALAIGTMIGSFMDWEGHVRTWSERLLAHFVGQGQAARIANAFVTGCLIMNVGAMVIVGPLQAGLLGDYDMLYTKSMLDFVIAIMLTALMGIGVMASAIMTLLIQGGIEIFATSLVAILSDQMIGEISCVGSLIIVAVGINMMKLKELNVLNFVPALFVAPILVALGNYLGLL